MYIKITPNMTTDHELVEDAMVKVSGDLPAQLDRIVISLSVTVVGNRKQNRDLNRPTNRQTDRQTDRQTNRPTDRQTDRPTDRGRGRLTDRQTDRQRGRPVSLNNLN